MFLLVSGGFLAGLGSFLTAHILYIIVFKKFFNQKNLIKVPLILAFVSCLYGFLYPNLGSMKIPVLLYACTIGLMLYIAVCTKAKWLIVGAILFVISDSILAINIFYEHSTIAGMAVMLSYALAQYCLTVGMIKKTNVADYKNVE